jgi:hypothetical protein
VTNPAASHGISRAPAHPLGELSSKIHRELLDHWGGIKKLGAGV